jgi:IS66 C-terminal element
MGVASPAIGLPSAHPHCLPLNRPDPEAYPRDVLGRIADHPVNRIDELLPRNLVASTADPQPRAG